MTKGSAHRGLLTKTDIGSPTNFRHISHNGQLLIDEPTNTDPSLRLLLPCRSQPADGSTTHESDSANQVSDLQPAPAAKRKAPLPPTNHTSSCQSDTQPVPHSTSEGDLTNLSKPPSLTPQRKAPLPPSTNQNVSSQPITRAVPHSASEGDLTNLSQTSSLSPQRKAPLPQSTNQTITNQQVNIPHSSSTGNLLDSNTSQHKKLPPRPPPPRFNSDNNTGTNTTNHVTSMLAMTAMTTFKLINTHLEDDASNQQQVCGQPIDSSKPDATQERVERETVVTEEARSEAEEALGAIEELDAMLLRFSAVYDGADSDDDDAPPTSQHVNHTDQDTESRAGGVGDVDVTGGLDDDLTPTTTVSTAGLNAGPENVDKDRVTSQRDALSNNLTDITGKDLPDIILKEGSTPDKEHPSGTLSDISRSSDSGINKCDSLINIENVGNRTPKEMYPENDVVETEVPDTEKIRIDIRQNCDEMLRQPETKEVKASLDQEEPEVDVSSTSSTSAATSTSSDVTSPGPELNIESAAPRPSVLNWNPKQCLRLEEIEDQELRLLLEKAGVSNDVLEDPDTRDFIYEFIQQHGGKKAVRQEALLLAGLPPTTLRRIRKKKKIRDMYNVAASSVEEDEDNMSTYM